MKRINTLLCLFSIYSLVVTTACAEQAQSQRRAEESYNRLCKIYTDVLSMNLGSYDSAVSLYSRFESMVPELNIVTENITSASREESYKLYKQAAESAIGKPWECPAIEKYYQKEWKE